ncbi:hypothetical protein Tco_0111475 [Tanacetum coccineum]
MKRGFQGAPRPLLPSMLLVATNPIAGQEHAAQAQSQTSTSLPPPIPSQTPTPIPTSTSPPPPIPSQTPTPIPTPTSPPPPPKTEPTTDEYLYEKHSPVHHHFSPLQEQAPRIGEEVTGRDEWLPRVVLAVPIGQLSVWLLAPHHVIGNGQIVKNNGTASDTVGKED